MTVGQVLLGIGMLLAFMAAALFVIGRRVVSSPDHRMLLAPLMAGGALITILTIRRGDTKLASQRTASPMRSASARFATILANRRPADGRRTTVVTPAEFRWPRIAPSSCRLGEIRP